MMEDYVEKIAKLETELKKRDRDIHLAATYGNQLVDDKAKLSAQVEELLSQKELLEQEKHTLHLELEAQIQTVSTQANELEFQRDETDILQEQLLAKEKENEEMYKKNQNLLKENHYLKELQEDLNVKNKSLRDKNDLLERQIRNFQEQAEKSLCEAENDENQELQVQLNSYMLNNKELQEALSQLQCEVDIAKKSEKHLLQMVNELEEAVCDRDSEIKGYCAELKKAKEEIEDLQGEIEVLKYDQVDVNRRGNSVFAELDDRRTFVEKEYKLLCKKYEQLKKMFEQHKTELDGSRAQMAILQRKVSRDYQQNYIDRLEESLSSAKREISELTNKLSKALKNNAEVDIEERNLSKRSEYDYLRVMLKQSQMKEKELQNEYMNLRMKNRYDNDKLIETQHLLYKAKADLDSVKQELSELKIKMKDMEQNVLLKYNVDIENRKPRTEILEGFKPPESSEKNDNLKKLNVSIYPDMNIIPGELELFDDGFRQIKPPRKSNKFILQEFNRIDDEETEDSTTSNKKKEVQEVAAEVEKTEQTSNQNQMLNQRHKSHTTKISSRRRNDNCAQQ